jgi:hypothetical protein
MHNEAHFGDIEPAVKADDKITSAELPACKSRAGAYHLTKPCEIIRLLMNVLR